MPGSPHPIDDVIVDALDVVKADVRSFVRDRTVLIMADATEVTNTDLSGQQMLMLSDTLRMYRLDVSDTTTAHDGISVLVDDANNRFKDDIGSAPDAISAIDAFLHANAGGL